MPFMPYVDKPSSATTMERAHVQRRVANLGLVLTGIGFVFVVMRVIAVLIVYQSPYLASTSMVVHYVAVLVSAGVWLTCRRGQLRLGTVYAVELTGLVVVSSLYAVMAEGMPQAFRPEMTILLAFGLFILAHAVHVPSSWKWTTAVGIALAVPLFIGAWAILTPMDPRIVAASASSSQSVQTSPESIIGIGMASVVTWWLVIVATASAVSAVIYGLRRDIRAAEQLGQYHLEGKLGEGGMGAVYRASHAMLRREAAIKLVRPELSGDGNLLSNAERRFEQEAQVTASLTSPHTVQLYDFGVSAEGAFYYVMELLDGINLETAVEKFGPFPPERVVFLMRQVCESLEEAHGAGLVHRDIKPANLFLCRQGARYDSIKVLDFGLVTIGREREGMNQKLTADGFVGGTPAYLAPEMVAKNDGVDGRADIYSLGCVAYWLLTGHAPFEGRSVMSTILAHVNEVPARPSTTTEIEIPPHLEDLVMHCLEKNPDCRPASAAELARLLSETDLDVTWSQDRAKDWWEIHKPRATEQPVAETDTPVERITKAPPKNRTDHNATTTVELGTWQPQRRPA